MKKGGELLKRSLEKSNGQMSSDELANNSVICARGGSRVRLIRQMTKSRFLKKLDTFYEI